MSEREKCKGCGLPPRYRETLFPEQFCECPKPKTPTFREPDEVVRELDETKYGEPSAPTAYTHVPLTTGASLTAPMCICSDPKMFGHGEKCPLSTEPPKDAGAREWTAVPRGDWSACKEHKGLDDFSNCARCGQLTLSVHNSEPASHYLDRLGDYRLAYEKLLRNLNQTAHAGELSDKEVGELEARIKELEREQVQHIDLLAKQYETELTQARAELARWENLYVDEVAKSAALVEALERMAEEHVSITLWRKIAREALAKYGEGK